MASKKPMLSQMKSMFRSSNMLKLGTFLGGFATIFRVSKRMFELINLRSVPTRTISRPINDSIEVRADFLHFGRACVEFKHDSSS